MGIELPSRTYVIIYYADSMFTLTEGQSFSKAEVGLGTGLSTCRLGSKPSGSQRRLSLPVEPELCRFHGHLLHFLEEDNVLYHPHLV